MTEKRDHNDKKSIVIALRITACENAVINKFIENEPKSDFLRRIIFSHPHIQRILKNQKTKKGKGNGSCN